MEREVLGVRSERQMLGGCERERERESGVWGVRSICDNNSYDVLLIIMHTRFY